MAGNQGRTARRWSAGMEQLTLRDLIRYWEFHNCTGYAVPMAAHRRDSSLYVLIAQHLDGHH